MNNGLTEIVEEIQTKFRRPPQVKSIKAQIHAKFHKIPVIRFEDQKLTSFCWTNPKSHQTTDYTICNLSAVKLLF